MELTQGWEAVVRRRLHFWFSVGGQVEIQRGFHSRYSSTSRLRLAELGWGQRPFCVLRELEGWTTIESKCGLNYNCLKDLEMFSWLFNRSTLYSVNFKERVNWSFGCADEKYTVPIYMWQVYVCFFLLFSGPSGGTVLRSGHHWTEGMQSRDKRDWKPNLEGWLEDLGLFSLEQWRLGEGFVQSLPSSIWRAAGGRGSRFIWNLLGGQNDWLEWGGKLWLNVREKLSNKWPTQAVNRLLALELFRQRHDDLLTVMREWIRDSCSLCVFHRGQKYY